jgi:hypothetical protein
MMRPTSRRALLGITTAIAAALPAFASAPLHPDAELLRLGAELEAAWGRENAHFDAGLATTDEGIEAAMAPCRDLVNQIELLPARTLEGLRVKARSVQWCCNEGSDDPNYFGSLDDWETTDIRISSSIIRDLLALGSANA